MNVEILARDPSSQARVGRLVTPHGTVATPAFMPCASRAVVKACSPQDVAEVGIELLMCNAFHLLLQPGPEVIAAAGGLHGFMDWSGPLVTDSGGFQVF